MPSLTIGQVAKEAQVSLDTIRLYERYGLIKEPQRAANGYRQYPNEIIDCLKFISRTKNMGFTLKEIKDLLAIHQTSQHTCGDVKARTQDKLKQVREKIEELRRLETALKQLLNTCEQHQGDDLCPLFTTMQSRENDHD
ncbi:TPA: MerR family DNA-binding protein [Legionella pneumophila]|nr:heavy metal-responsive transcriptional regulator [Legionella pneumophila]HAT1987733.1 heavy metal-responsive transcriptional regulator [Legionella pneumophila]HAT7910036.1 MerR family DNA-binding protein [Legionella pneumophila]HAT7913533.1 MerR family DNA-binding protein [Legionella pneumophila]HAT7916614.1 MerR family DNA-binding protein [Legionella pneumophila]HAT7983336.1 MerR family DNA-binding protein [Legionella pneumophila]